VAIYSGIYSGPPRHYGSTRTDKRYVAIHNTSNDATAEEEASYAKRRGDSVSSHYYVDNNSLLQSLDTALRAYHAGSTIGNSQAIAYEITGTNSKTRSWWLANVAWPLLARQIAADCREHDIEPRLLTVAEIKAGSRTGIITHDQMRLAWGGTTHTDPGANFPLDHLLALVQAEMEDDMTPEQDRLLRNVERILTTGWSERDAYDIQYKEGSAKLVLENPFVKLDKKLTELAARPAADVDEAALAAALAPLIAAAVAATLAAKLGG
jgi:N-acetyl-anhydromuramyl-L-alanine amidase AmpD